MPTFDHESDGPFPESCPEIISIEYVESLLRAYCLFSYAPEGIERTLVRLLVKLEFLTQSGDALAVTDDPCLLQQLPDLAGRELFYRLKKLGDAEGNRYFLSHFLSIPTEPRPDDRISCQPMLDHPRSLGSQLRSIRWNRRKLLAECLDSTRAELAEILDALEKLYELMIGVRTDDLATFVRLKDVCYMLAPRIRSLFALATVDDIEFKGTAPLAQAITNVARAWNLASAHRSRQREIPIVNTPYCDLPTQALALAIETEDETLVGELLQSRFSRKEADTTPDIVPDDALLALSFCHYFQALVDLHGGYWASRAATIQLVGRASSSGDSAESSPKARYAWAQCGDSHEIVFEEVRTLLRATQGLAYLRELVRQQGQPVPCEFLESPGLAGALPKESDQVILDPRAFADLNSKLSELSRDLERARRDNDEASIGRLTEEQEAVKEQLRQDMGLKGKSRKMHSEKEKCRVRVAQAIRSALGVLSKNLPALEKHFREALQTPSGSSPCYRPDPRLAWRIS